MANTSPSRRWTHTHRNLPPLDLLDDRFAFIPGIPVRCLQPLSPFTVWARHWLGDRLVTLSQASNGTVTQAAARRKRGQPSVKSFFSSGTDCNMGALSCGRIKRLWVEGRRLGRSGLEIWHGIATL